MYGVGKAEKRICHVTMQIGSVKCADMFFFPRQDMWTIWSLTLTDNCHPVFRSDLIAQCVICVRSASRLKRHMVVRIQSTLLRLWLLCDMSVIVLVNQLPAFRVTWGHTRGYLMWNMKIEMAIICGDAAIIIIMNVWMFIILQNEVPVV